MTKKIIATKTLAPAYIQALRLMRGGFECKKEGYASLIKMDVMQAMASVKEPVTFPFRDLALDDMRVWGLKEFPDFQLSPEDLQEAVGLAAALRAFRTK